MKEVFRSLEEFRELNSEKYDLIYTDPPWQQTKGGLRGCRPNQQKVLDYDTMTMADIKEFHREVFKHCNAKHNVFMWTNDKYLHETEKMMNELGYELHARMIWIRQTALPLLLQLDIHTNTYYGFTEKAIC